MTQSTGQSLKVVTIAGANDKVISFIFLSKLTDVFSFCNKIAVCATQIEDFSR